MTRPRIYFDNAATSFPKPPQVICAMREYAEQLGASPGRGSYHEAQEAGHLIARCRQRINKLINGENANHVVFTLNATDALNMAIRGLVRTGDHVITTWLDHNSVLRPFNDLVEASGVTQSRVTCDPNTGLVDPNDITRAITPRTRLITVAHGSNVIGTIQPLREIGRIAREHGVTLLVDAAQTLGHYPIDVQRDHVDLLAFPGHKGLLGPLGTGGLYIRPGIEQQMCTYRQGGTGSASEHDVQPDFMPDRFEPGSHNAIGIIGLSEGVKWILERGVNHLREHEVRLSQVFINALSANEQDGLSWYGPNNSSGRCGVFSVRVSGIQDPCALSNALEHDYGLLTRSGLHCAPLAHKTIGTYDLGGTTRFSVGPSTTEDDVRAACNALAEICRRHTAVSV